MKNLKFIFVLSTIFFWGNLLSAQDAKEIVRKSHERMRGNTSTSSITMKIVRPKWERTISMKSWSKGDDFSMILITAPARDQGAAFLKRDKEVWNWQPSINRNIKLPPSMMSQSWMGSDFSNDDLVRQASIVEDYTHKIIGSEKIQERDCYKIQLIPKPNAPVVWGKVLLWISKTDYLQLKTEMYDEDSYLVNTMLGSQIKTMGGRIIPTYMEMIPAGKQGHKTVLIYNALSFDQPIADDFFSVQNMTKVK